MSSRSKKKRNRRNSNSGIQKIAKPIVTENNRAVIQQTTTIKSGPLPTPEDLQKYAEISPDLVDRIVGMAEKQQAHRHHVEKKDQKIIPFLYVLGQFFGFLIAIAVIISGTFLLYNNKNLEGFAVLLGGGAGLISIYMYGKRRDKYSMAHDEGNQNNIIK